MVERWETAGPDELWSLLEAAWLTGITASTLRRYIADGALAGTTTDRGRSAVRTEDLRPLVEAGARTYGPSITADSTADSTPDSATQAGGTGQ